MRITAAALALIALAGCRSKETPRAVIAQVPPSSSVQATPPPREKKPAASAVKTQPSGARWNALARLPEELTGAVVSAVDGKIVVIGGNPASGVPTAAVNAFDLNLRIWTPLSAAPQSLGYPAVAVLNGSIFVAGGCVRLDCSFPTAAVNTYDPKADIWTPLPPLPEALFAGQGAALNGRFYVFGGVAGPVHQSGASARVYAYDPAARTWSRLRDMTRRRSHFGGAGFDGRFVLAGGCTSAAPGHACDEITAEADAYDAGSDSWSSFPALPVPLWAHGAASDDGRIIVAGGSSVLGPVGGGRTFILERGVARWVEGPSLLRTLFYPFLFNLPRGVGIFGTHFYSNTAGDDLIESLGAPGPFVDPGEEPGRAPVAVEPSPRPRSAIARTPSPAPAFDAENPENLPAAVASRPHAHAVVIGVERYRETLPRADFAASDAKLTAEYFRRMLGVPEENLAFLSDDRATKSDFEKYFERWLPNRVEAGDEVYVYFSGHGAPDPKTGESYLVPFDADPTYIEQTGYPIKKMYEQLAKLPAKRVLLVMDSCFSGAGGRSVIAQGARPLVSVVQSEVPRGLTVISASAGDQISNSYHEKRHGLFTYFFLKGLKEKGGDFRAVYDYLKPQVSRVARRQYNSDQDPQWRKGK